MTLRSTSEKKREYPTKRWFSCPARSFFKPIAIRLDAVVVKPVKEVSDEMEDFDMVNPPGTSIPDPSSELRDGRKGGRGQVLVGVGYGR